MLRQQVRPSASSRFKIQKAKTVAGERRRIRQKAKVAAAVGLSDATESIAQKPAIPESDNVRQERLIRILFMGRRIRITEGNEQRAKDALQTARAKKRKWTDGCWQLEQERVLREFREGIKHGGMRLFRADSSQPALEKGRSGLEEAAVGVQVATGSSKTKGNVCTQRPVDCPAIAPIAERRVEAAPPSVSNPLYAIGGQDIETILNRVRLEMLSKYLGGGSF